jgi:hypothetical protein
MYDINRNQRIVLDACVDAHFIALVIVRMGLCTLTVVHSRSAGEYGEV